MKVMLSLPRTTTLATRSGACTYSLMAPGSQLLSQR